MQENEELIFNEKNLKDKIKLLNENNSILEEYSKRLFDYFQKKWRTKKYSEQLINSYNKML